MHESCGPIARIQEGRCHRRVDTTGKSANHATLAHDLADRLDLSLDQEVDPPRCPGSRRLGGRSCPARSPRRAPCGSPRDGTAGRRSGLVRCLTAANGHVSVAASDSIVFRSDRRPDRRGSSTRSTGRAGRRRGRSTREHGTIVRPNSRTSPRRHGFPRAAGSLHAVADAQDGDSQVEDGRIGLGRLRIVNAGRPTGKDQPARGQFADSFGRQVVTDELAKDVGIANPPGDQLGRLTTKVEHEHAVFVLGQREFAAVGCRRFRIRQSCHVQDLGLDSLQNANDQAPGLVMSRQLYRCALDFPKPTRQAAGKGRRMQNPARSDYNRVSRRGSMFQGDTGATNALSARCRGGSVGPENHDPKGTSDLAFGAACLAGGHWNREFRHGRAEPASGRRTGRIQSARTANPGSTPPDSLDDVARRGQPRATAPIPVRAGLSPSQVS